jgi:DNA-binding XRE family transcriptional regulator
LLYTLNIRVIFVNKKNEIRHYIKSWASLILRNLKLVYMNDLQLLTDVGAKIKKIRTEKKMSQNDLAVLCSFEKASMSRIESGKTNITILTLLKISKALNVEIAELLTK